MDELWRKARGSADSARLLFEEGHPEDACNRAYYAMFNAARALLANRGVGPADVRTHASVWRLFSLHYIKDGPLNAELGRALAQAGRARNQADYSPILVEAETVQDVMRSLDQFMQMAETMLAESSNGERSHP